jgi:chromosome segregation ATPase
VAEREEPDEPLEDLRASLAREPIERDVPILPDSLDTTSEEVADLKSIIAVRESQLTLQVQEGNELRATVSDLAARLEEQQTLRARSEGELQQIRSSVDSVIAEREDLRRRLDDVRADFETRLSDTVRQALAEQEQEHAAERQKLIDERLQLRTQLDATTAERDDLKLQVEQSGGEATTAADDLAARFASVLSDLAEAPVAADKPYGVSLTSMEVEARGVLHMEDDKPQLVTSREGKDPGQLSTVRMQFRTVPRIPGSGTPQER